MHNETVETNPEETLIHKLSQYATVMQLVDALLKRPRSFFHHIQTDEFSFNNSLKLAFISLMGLLVYGLIIGSFSGNIQWVASPIKIIVGTVLTALLCYPSLYILVALSGADLRPAQIGILLISSIALTAILLLGFAPVAFIFTFSIQTLPFMGLIHLILWLGSLYFSLDYLAKGLVQMGSKDVSLVKFWLVIFIITLLQMSTTLRPILGQEEYLLTTEKKFFLHHWFESLDKSR
ncbi:MAG: hypothetical protein RIT27_975 [Pseudomonadota bacterium]|jgi:hypothetical protein